MEGKAGKQLSPPPSFAFISPNSQDAQERGEVADYVPPPPWARSQTVT